MASYTVLIGAKFDNVSIDNIFPAGRTVCRHANEVAAHERQELISLIAFFGQNMWYGITIDMWTETNTSSSYITVTLHFVDNGWQMCSRILATRLMEDRSTAANVQQAAENILAEFGVLQTSNVFETNNGSNMKVAFSNNGESHVQDMIFILFYLTALILTI